ncbi:hypothetical protein ACFL45_11820, partial [Candidatus Neomarinimicrobiota bacterium]
CTLPPRFEGFQREVRARTGLLWLSTYASSNPGTMESNTITFDYDEIAKEIGEHKKLMEVFRVGSDKMADCVKNLVEASG